MMDNRQTEIAQDGANGNDEGGRKALSSHILPTSATMLGVCMTVIGIVKVVEAGRGNSHIDELFAIDGILFMLSAAFSYLSIRSRRQGARLESIADTLFMVGIGLMGIIGVVFAFELV